MKVAGHEIRLSTEADATELSRLWQLSGPAAECRFDRVENAWVVAERGDGTLAGAIQLFHSRPTSHIDNLLMDERIVTTEPGQVMGALIRYGVAVLSANGSEFVTTCLDPERESWCRHAVRDGWAPLWPRILMAKRLRDRPRLAAVPAGMES